MATFFDDFSAYSAGAISSVATANWSVQSAGTGDWSQEIVTDAGATGGKVAVITRSTAGASSNRVVHDTAGLQSGDVEVVARYKFDMSSTASAAIGPTLIAADGQAYGWSCTGATTVRLVRFSTTLAASTNIGAGNFTITVPDQAYVWARVGRSGTTIRAKIWLDGEAEPGTWSNEGTNTTLTDVKAGFVCRVLEHPPLTVDVFGIGTAGSSAPTSASSGGGLTLRRKQMALLNTCAGPFGPKFF